MKISGFLSFLVYASSPSSAPPSPKAKQRLSQKSQNIQVIWQRCPDTRHTRTHTHTRVHTCTPFHAPQQVVQSRLLNGSRFSREMFSLWSSEVSVRSVDSAPCRFSWKTGRGSVTKRQRLGKEKGPDVKQTLPFSPLCYMYIPIILFSPRTAQQSIASPRSPFKSEGLTCQLSDLSGITLG